MESTRRAFFFSLAVSLFTAWFYFGFPPLTQGVLPMNEGTLVNTLIKIVAIPLTLAIIAGGGLAAAYALGIATDRRRNSRRPSGRKLALAGPGRHRLGGVRGHDGVPPGSRRQCHRGGGAERRSRSCACSRTPFTLGVLQHS